MTSITACRLASRNLVHHVLELHKLNAGKFIKHVRDVNALTIDSVTDFGDKQHSVHAEPYFYDSGCRHAFQPTRLSIDKNNRCLYIENLSPNSEEFIFDKTIPVDINGRAHICDNLGCSYACRAVSDRVIECILDIKQAFTKPLAQVREILHNIDEDCSHIHHLKPRGMEDEDLASTELFKLGPPLPCSSGMCDSKLRVLRAASVHFPVLRKLLYSVYMARKCHDVVSKIDHTLVITNHYVIC